MDSLNMAPNNLRESLEIQSEAINAPRIGTNDNYAYSSMQLNFAAAVEEGTGEALRYLFPTIALRLQNLTHLTARDNRGSLGKFGKSHRDAGDTAGGTTCMISLNSMPPYYRSGRFHLLELGVYVTLNNFVCINFYGQRYHGGTPPTCPSNKTLAPHAVRTSLVCYPNGAMMNGTSLYAFASLPHGHLFCIRPEMIQLL